MYITTFVNQFAKYPQGGAERSQTRKCLLVPAFKHKTQRSLVWTGLINSEVKMTYWECTYSNGDTTFTITCNAGCCETGCCTMAEPYVFKLFKIICMNELSATFMLRVNRIKDL